MPTQPASGAFAGDRDHDAQLVAAATRIVAAAMQDGDRLSQAALAGRAAPRGLHRRQRPAPLAVLRQRPRAAPRRRAGRAPVGRPVMARRIRASSEDHHKRAEDHEQRLAALRIRLQETAQEIRTAEDWTPVPAGSRTAPRRKLGEHPAHLVPDTRRDAGQGI